MRRAVCAAFVGQKTALVLVYELQTMFAFLDVAVLRECGCG
jgi:hypothetical protein